MIARFAVFALFSLCYFTLPAGAFAASDQPRPPCQKNQSGQCETVSVLYATAAVAAAADNPLFEAE